MRRTIFLIFAMLLAIVPLVASEETRAAIEPAVPDVELLRPVPDSPYPIDRTPLDPISLRSSKPLSVSPAGPPATSGEASIAQTGTYWAQVGVYPNSDSAYKNANGWATNIETKTPTSITGGNVFYWVGARIGIPGSQDWIQVGYYIKPTEPNNPHPFWAAWHAGGGCSPGQGTCEYKDLITLAPGSWHQFWFANNVDGDPKKWGIYMDSWSNRIGVWTNYYSNTGDNLANAMTEIAGASWEYQQAYNTAIPPTQFYYALQVFKSNAWTIPADGFKTHGYEYRCEQLGIVTYVQQANVKMGGNGPCPGQPLGTQMW